MAIWLLFVMAGVLLYSSLSKAFLLPSLWTLEMAQFLMAAYYLLGGPYSMQQGAHVRMDLAYGFWPPRLKAAVDAFTSLFLLFFLGVLLFGGIVSAQYAVEYQERSYSVWRPLYGADKNYYVHCHRPHAPASECGVPQRLAARLGPHPAANASVLAR